MKESVKELMGDITKEMKEVCKGHVGNGMTSYTLNSIDYAIRNRLSGKTDIKHIVVICNPDPMTPDKVIVKPGNLFTFLIMNNVFVRYKDVKGKDRYETEFATYIVEGEEYFIQPKRPTESVTLEFRINKEEK